MSVKVILFNGPPRSGKDTAAAAVLGHLHIRNVPVVHRKFAAPLKEAAHLLLGLPQDADTFEDTKDQPLDEFYGNTPRNAYIALSEKFVKPLFGDDTFANTFCRNIKLYLKSIDYNSIVVVSDCGFATEAKIAAETFGKENVLIVQVARPDCDFSKDSRSYIDGTFFGCKTILINNSFDKYSFVKQAIQVVETWLPPEWLNAEEQSD